MTDAPATLSAAAARLSQPVSAQHPALIAPGLAGPLAALLEVCAEPPFRTAALTLARAILGGPPPPERPTAPAVRPPDGPGGADETPGAPGALRGAQTDADGVGNLRDRIANRRADQAEAALARLHEGEEPHPEHATIDTPGQWLWIWNRATPAQRLEVAARVIANGERASRCFLMNHEARLAQSALEHGEDHL